mmetsp:Transcript_39164/g.122512  ORF Transcript_39164/g.122512 Transcript_39164/m.122512 type:complete len:203 (+) Transcript_39164:254-862(+)
MRQAIVRHSGDSASFRYTSSGTRTCIALPRATAFRGNAAETVTTGKRRTSMEMKSAKPFSWPVPAVYSFQFKVITASVSDPKKIPQMRPRAMYMVIEVPSAAVKTNLAWLGLAMVSSSVGTPCIASWAKMKAENASPNPEGSMSTGASVSASSESLCSPQITSATSAVVTMTAMQTSAKRLSEIWSRRMIPSLHMLKIMATA